MTAASEQNSGFTLLELLVVVAIMGLLAIVMPHLLPVGGARLRSETQRLLADLQMARTDAVRTGHPIFVTFDQSSYAVTPGSYRRDLPAGERLGRVQTDAGVLGLESNRTGFFPDGSATGSLIMLGDGHASKTIEINALDGRATARD